MTSIKSFIFWFIAFATLLFLILCLIYSAPGLFGLYILGIDLPTIFTALSEYSSKIPPSIIKVAIFFFIGYIIYIISLYYFSQTESEKSKIKYVLTGSILSIFLILFGFLGTIISSEVIK